MTINGSGIIEHLTKALRLAETEAKDLSLPIETNGDREHVLACLEMTLEDVRGWLKN